MSPNALSSPQSPEITATNTLIVTNLDRPVFLPENFVELKANFEQYGSIHKFIPIKSFNRMLVIYFQTSDAETAKAYSDRMIFMDKVVRVYYGLHTPVIDETDSFKHLNIPKLEKNWLISPPGSPPFGWTPTHETGPNEKTLADDLTHTLVNICLNNNSNSNGVDIIYEDEIENFSLDNDHNNDDNNSEKSLQFMPPPSTTTTTTSKIPILKIISNDLGADDNHKDDVPMIFIQDWDDSSSLSTATSNNKIKNFNYLQTKAQLHPNMMFSSSTSSPSSSIMPTPRPPIIY